MGLLYEKLLALDELPYRECVITIRLGKDKDNIELYVENCKKVLSCDSEFITLKAGGAEIRVSGAPLALENFGVEGVKITGKIASIDFSESSE